jgi:hypothetical protein
MLVVGSEEPMECKLERRADAPAKIVGGWYRASELLHRILNRPRDADERIRQRPVEVEQQRWRQGRAGHLKQTP